jgi:hypothetical protein
MKQLKTLLAVVLLTTIFASCKKEKDDLPEPPKAFKVEGAYVGKLGSGSEIPNGYFEIVLKPGGALERVGLLGGVDGTGTWQLSGNDFTAEYKNTAGTVTVNLDGTLNKEQKRISGNWSSTNGKSGKFHATKN